MSLLPCRKFLGLFGIAGLFSGDRLLASNAGSSEAAQVPGYKALKPAQVAALAAIPEQIIPADNDPGAREAGVVHYIDKVLSRNRYENLPPYEAGLVVLAGYQFAKLPVYASGLEGTDQTSQLLYGRNFVRLSFDQ